MKSLNLNKTDKKVIRIVAYIVGGGGLLGLLSFGGYKFYTHLQMKMAMEKAMGQGPDFTYAARLEMAFENDGWPGTNETLVREVIQEIPSTKMWEKVKKAYRKISGGKGLVAQLKSELKATEWEEMRLILLSKPKKEGSNELVDHNMVLTNWANRLKAAFDYRVVSWIPGGTDPDAVKAVLQEVPTQKVWEELKATYFTEHAEELEERMDSELDFIDFEWKEIIEQKPMM